MRHYFTETMKFERPEPHHKLCFQADAVTLQQRGRDNFAVRYGKEVHAEMTYGQACDYLGRALLHQLACEEKLDNGVGRRRAYSV